MRNQHCWVYFSLFYKPKFKPLLSWLTCVCYRPYVHLTFAYIKTALSSEPRGKKAPGHLINLMLRKIIQTELIIVPPTELQEHVWKFPRVLPARC